MSSSFFRLFSLVILFITAVEASLSHQSLRRLSRRVHHHNIANASLSYADDPAELVKRDGGKYVFMHHVRVFLCWHTRVLTLILDCW